MSSAVTTSTVMTVNSTIYFGMMGLILAVTLFVLLFNKEILSSSTRPSIVTIRRALNVAILPLLLSFLIILMVSLTNTL